ncbi:MAG: hypothetical protein JNL97_02965 [Verrucomicrobiales bacterium]|nr:hypothetical protein [Verrucomicrobiales bacterium]
MNKKAVLNLIVAKLVEDAELYFRAARAAQSEATDEQSKAENKYDTRGLEASYLARGQSRQAAETESALAQFKALASAPPPPAETVDVGALVGLKSTRGTDFFFVGPCMGGTEVVHEGHEITVITPQSPLGQQLVGRRLGDRIKLPSGADRRIASVD